MMAPDSLKRQKDALRERSGPPSPAPRPGSPISDSANHLFLYDGVCGLCNRINRFILRFDREGRFDFASLQSPTADALLQQFGKNAGELSTFYVVTNYQSASPEILSKARGALFVATALGWPWRAAAVVGILPAPALEFLYDLVARYRYRVFGREDTCPLPPLEHRKRFIDV
jgi:predicted DCC family thiol-disulfide oxidoreductase YuxK